MRVLVVDDEPVARRVLLRFLREDPEVSEVVECTNGEQARALLGAGETEVVFLDIHMPGMDGFEALEGRRPDAPLAVVFVTAYEEHALRAIDAGAAAYLLKPFDQPGFERAFERAKAQLHRERVVQKSAELSELLGVVRPEPSPNASAERITVPEGGGLRRIAVAEIRWVEAADKHVVIHRDGEDLRVRMTLSELEAQLDPRRFLRVHRCNLVAIERIEALGQTAGGAPYLEIDRGERVVVSRSRVRAVRAALG